MDSMKRAHKVEPVRATPESEWVKGEGSQEVMRRARRPMGTVGKFRRWWKSTLVGDYFTRMYRRNLGKWWWLSFFQSIRTFGVVPGLNEVARKFKLPGPTGERTVFAMDITRKQASVQSVLHHARTRLARTQAGSDDHKDLEDFIKQVEEHLKAEKEFNDWQVESHDFIADRELREDIKEALLFKGITEPEVGTPLNSAEIKKRKLTEFVTTFSASKKDVKAYLKDKREELESKARECESKASAPGTKPEEATKLRKRAEQLRNMFTEAEAELKEGEFSALENLEVYRNIRGDKKAGKEIELSYRGSPAIPAINEVKVRLNGRYYWAGVGDGGTFGLFEEVPDAKIWHAFSPKHVYYWREYWKNNSHVLPPSSLHDWHSTLGMNRLKPGQTAEKNFELMLANLQNTLTGPTGITMWHAFLNESLSKRVWNHEIGKITGRLLAAAVNMNAFDVGESSILSESVAGYIKPESNALSIDPGGVFNFSSLGPGDQLAVLRYLIAEGLPSSQFEVGKGLTPARRNELKRMYDSEKDAKMKQVIDSSLKQDFDWVLMWQRTAKRAQSYSEIVQNLPKIIVEKDGVADVAQLQFDAHGRIVTHMPAGAKPFMVPRWDIPTIGPQALRLLYYLPRYKPFLTMLADTMKREDMSLFEALTEKRQWIKGYMGGMLHEGIVDDPADLAAKASLVFGLNPKKANDIFLTIHAFSPKGDDGSRWDEMRRQLGQFLDTIDDTVKLEYCSPVDIDFDKKQQILAFERRGKLLMRLGSNRSLMQRMLIAEEATKQGNADLAARLRREVANEVAESFSSEILSSAYHETEPLRVDRRSRNVVNFFNENWKLLSLLFIGPANLQYEMEAVEKRDFKATGVGDAGGTGGGGGKGGPSVAETDSLVYTAKELFSHYEDLQEMAAHIAAVRKNVASYSNQNQYNFTQMSNNLARLNILYQKIQAIQKDATNDDGTSKSDEAEEKAKKEIETLLGNAEHWVIADKLPNPRGVRSFGWRSDTGTSKYRTTTDITEERSRNLSANIQVLPLKQYLEERLEKVHGGDALAEKWNKEIANTDSTTSAEDKANLIREAIHAVQEDLAFDMIQAVQGEPDRVRSFIGGLENWYMAHPQHIKSLPLEHLLTQHLKSQAEQEVALIKKGMDETMTDDEKKDFIAQAKFSAHIAQIRLNPWVFAGTEGIMKLKGMLSTNMHHAQMDAYHHAQIMRAKNVYVAEGAGADKAMAWIMAHASTLGSAIAAAKAGAAGTAAS